MKRIKLVVKNIYCNGCADLIKKEIIREFKLKLDKLIVERINHDEHNIIIDSQKKINEIDMYRVLHRRNVELLNFEEKNIKKVNS